MIKIADKVWAVLGAQRAENLAYMCQVTTNKAGEPDSPTKKMQETGRKWARWGEQWQYVQENGQYVKDENGQYKRHLISEAEEGVESYHENTPTKGFYIGSSVSRWTTENKVFNVADPRGFMVQVATGNIETLLHTCTVVKGVIQEECVWGREGNNHVLLPIHSEEYITARGQIQRVSEALKASDLTPGDRVTLQSYGEEQAEVVFLGMVKLEWNRKAELITYARPADRWMYSYGYTIKQGSEDLGNETAKDDKWLAVFAKEDTKYVRKDDTSGYDEVAYTNVDFELNPKVLSRTPGEVPENYVLTEEFLMNGFAYGVSCPERVQKKFTHQRTDEYQNQHLEKRVQVVDSIVGIYAKK